MSVTSRKESENHKYLVTQLVENLRSIIRAAREFQLRNEYFPSFDLLLERMESILTPFQNVQTEDLPHEIRSAVEGIEVDLQRLQVFLDTYKNKGRLFVLIHSPQLVNDVKEITDHLAHWVSLALEVENPQIQEMKQLLKSTQENQVVQLKVSESEQHVLNVLEKEAWDPSLEVPHGQSLVNEIAHVLGMELNNNRSELLEEIQCLKRDTKDQQDQHEKQMVDVIEKLFYNILIKQDDVPGFSSSDLVEDDPFEPFLCPLTKQVMKDPVMLDSGQSYERCAIEKWFQQCKDQELEPFCPLTGTKLISTELRANYGLRQTIEEWTQRTVNKHIRIAVTHLMPTSSVKDKEDALDDIIRIAEDSSLNKYKLAEAGLVPLILDIWQHENDNISHLHVKGLQALLGIAMDNIENKVAIVEAGALRFVVRSVNCSSDKEKENAFKLLYELSKDITICEKICSQKGAILYVSGATVNADNLTISELAKKTLKNLERPDSTVLLMAELGRFGPLLKRLHQGPEEKQIEMAEYLAQITLLNHGKKQVAMAGTSILVQLLSSNVRAKEAGLGALLNLSTSEEIPSILINADILPPLLNIIFSVRVASVPKMKEMASDILANLVANPGWELAPIDTEGNTLQSNAVIYNLLALLTHAGFDWKLKLLQILYGLVSSPQAAVSVAEHLIAGNGIPLIVDILQQNEGLLRLQTLKLLNALAIQNALEVLEALRKAKILEWLRETMKGNTSGGTLEEPAVATSVLANIPLSDGEVIAVLRADLIEWIVATITDIINGRQSGGPLGKGIIENLLGVLLHFSRSNDSFIIGKMIEHQLLLIFKEQLLLPGQKLIKQRAATGLQLLSEKSNILVKTVEQRTGFCSPLTFLCRPRSFPYNCSVHFGVCKISQSFCLIQADAVRPLLQLLEVEDLDLWTAAIEALSTLLSDSVNFRGGVHELQRAGGVQQISAMFAKIRAGNLQEKTVWVLERCLRVDECAQNYLIDQRLFKALVDAYKHGSPTTRVLAQEGLTHLKRLSGVGSQGKRSRT